MTPEKFNRCIQSIKCGDNSGMQELYEYYYQKLFFTAMREFNNSFIAEDIASNVLISIFNNAANYGYIKSPNAYIYKCAFFAIVNYRTKNAKYIFAEHIETSYPTSEERVDLKIELWRIMDKLSKVEQEIVLQHFVYGMTINDTAKILKISSSTVKRRINDLKDELKNSIDFY